LLKQKTFTIQEYFTMKLGFSQQEIIATAKSLGLPSDGFIQRRVARAFDLVESKKVSQIDDGIFRVRSQYDEGKSYIVNVNSGEPSCDCPDGERTINCKHRIASLLYARKQAQAITIVKTTDGLRPVDPEGNEGDYWRRCWCIAQGNRRTVVYEEHSGRLFCNCGAYYQDCKHKQLVIKTVTLELKSIAKEKRVVNECGSNEAKALQDKLNGQLDSQNNNGNGAKAPSQPMQLDLNNPFEESESYDIDQIEGRRNGELAWKLSNGEYVISYAGVMKLAEKHDIDFPTIIKTQQAVIAYAQTNGSLRLSGKPVRTYDTPIETVCELAKRNAARQLLPLPEIKAVEHKAKLTAEFDWQKAKAKCVELVGIEANVDIIIHELTQAGKLRQDNPSHYDRTEWLIIHSACKQDASNNNNDGGGPNPSSSKYDDWKSKRKKCEDAAANEVRYCWIRSDLEREGTISNEHPSEWKDRDFETLRKACALDASLFNRGIGDDWTLVLETNKGVWAYERRYRFWLVTADTNELREKCFCCRRRFITNHNHGKTRSQAQMTDDLIHWERYYIKTVVCADCLKETTKADMTKRFDELYHNGNGAVDTIGLPKTAEDFIARCREAIDKVREKKNAVEANEQPLEGSNGKRKIQMDKKLRTWLIESDLTSKGISCREICEKFESEKNPNIVTRLRAGIDSGADISTVELD
jgi:hypothetical protein